VSLAVFCLAAAGPARSITYVWDFSVPAGSQASPHTYLDNTATYALTAYGNTTVNGPTSVVINVDTWGPGGGYTNNTGTIASHNLYGKNSGPGEIGLGLAGLPSDEIQFQSFVQLDLTNLYANGFTNLTMTVSSMQDGEGYYLWGSNTLGVPGVLLKAGLGPPVDETFMIPEFGTYTYFSVSATPIISPHTASDVLILDGLTARIPEDTTIVTELDPPGPIGLGQTVQDHVNISTGAPGAQPDATGTWTVEASKDITFGSGVIVVDSGAVSGQLPFNVTTIAWAPPSGGIWYFRATYSGDTNWTGSTSNPADEALTVTDPSHHCPVYQAYPASGEFSCWTGYVDGGVGGPVIEAMPGILCIDPRTTWANYVAAAFDDVPYTLKNVLLVKTTPPFVQCSDVFSSHTVTQLGTPNIRLWWPLMYETPGTLFTLSILYGTPVLYDDDGPGPHNPAWVHLEQWTWPVEADFESLADLLAVFHQQPFGQDEVPLISDELLYDVLQQKVAAANDAYEAGDTATAATILTDFEMEVMDACIDDSPMFPNPTGPGTGIANSAENPACCKLLVDVEYILQTTGIGMPKMPKK
jgi:hypothetical protein